MSNGISTERSEEQKKGQIEILDLQSPIIGTNEKKKKLTLNILE